MSHLSRDERLLVLDDALPPARQAHLASCPSCRAEVEALASVVARVKAVDVPEPSPLFWDHLAARVGDAISREPAPQRPPWWAPRPLWGVAAAALIVAALAGYWSVRTPAPTPGTVVRTASDPAHPAAPVTPDSLVADRLAPEGAGDAEVASPDDEGWGLIAAMAEDADLETLAPAAGGSELTIAGLSADEREALVRELEAALAATRGREG
jgi:hypothetical protein